MCAAVILSLAVKWLEIKKRRNLYLLPSYKQRLLAIALLMSDGNAEAHARICNPKASGYILANVVPKA